MSISNSSSPEVAESSTWSLRVRLGHPPRLADSKSAASIGSCLDLACKQKYAYIIYIYTTNGKAGSYSFVVYDSDGNSARIPV